MRSFEETNHETNLNELICRLHEDSSNGLGCRCRFGVIITTLVTSGSSLTTSIGLRTSVSRFIFVDMPASIASFSSGGTISKRSVHRFSIVVKFSCSSRFGGLITSPIVYCTS